MVDLQSLKNADNFVLSLLERPPFSYVIRIIAWLPVLLSAALLLMGYYGFVVIVCYQHLFFHGYSLLGAFGATTFSVLWVIGVTCFCKATFCSPGTVPQSFKEKFANAQAEASATHQTSLVSEKPVDVQCVPTTGGSKNTGTDVRQKELEALKNGFIVCSRCDEPRPPRSHHCKHCKKCVLKMDHHCPIVNNCIGHKNHKFFILTILYCFVGCFEAFLIGMVWLFAAGLPVLSVREFCCYNFVLFILIIM